MKSRILRILAVFLFAAGLMVSCATTPEEPPEPPRYEDLKIEELERLVEGNPAEGVEATLYLLKHNPILDREYVSGLLKRSLEGIVSRYEARLAAEDYSGARADSRTLRFIQDDPEVSHWLPEEVPALVPDAELTARIAEGLCKDGKGTAGLITFLDALDSGYRDPSVLREFATRAYELRNRHVLLRISAVSPESLSDEARAWSKTRDTMTDMRKGTVTIWVNRGIKIDQGVGTPDRVIGSGFFVDTGGYVLTNYHVISSEVDPEYEGYSRLYIRLPGQTTDRIPARVVGWDKVFDLALLKADIEPPYVFSFTGRRDFVPGDRVFAIGSPVGLDNTVTAGIVSAVGRRFLPLGEVIQVDAAINPGNSGGPLLDEEGELAGVVFAGIPRYQGLNFAVPAVWAARLLPDLFSGGEVKHPWLGIAAYEGRDGLSAIYRHLEGSSAAPSAGKLVRIAGRETQTLSDAQAVLLSHTIGTLVPVDVRKDDTTTRSWVLLRSRPFSPGETAFRKDLRERILTPFFGMSVSSLGRNEYVVEKVLPGTIADEAGISERDPLVIKDIVLDKEQRALYMSLYIKKRKAGFLDSVIQIGTSLDLDSFL